MSNGEPRDAEELVAQVSGWLEKAFPGHQCPKCGNDKFYVLDPPPQPLAAGELTFGRWPITKIACARCGFVEEHLTGLLKRALEQNNFQPLVKTDRHE